jgi:hypothetical protein
MSIKAQISHPFLKVEYTTRFFEFEVIGYGVPADCLTHPWYQLGGRYANWYYINSNGYAQIYDVDRPPSKHPEPARLIVAPVYGEPIYMFDAREGDFRRRYCTLL